MSKFTPGTLVLITIPTNYKRHELAPTSGSIGEVMDGSKFHTELPVGSVCVNFPNYQSDKTTGWWAVPTTMLTPLSDPDLSDDILKDEEFDKKYEDEYSH